MVVIFLGPPGCGKGTQAESLVNNNGFVHVSTGDLLRKEINEQTDLGCKVQAQMASGQLVEDQTILSLITKKLDSLPGNKVLFDGFPRTLDQARALEELLQALGKKIDCVFDFHVDEKKLYERIVGRFACVKCSAVYHDPSIMPKVKGVCDYCGSHEFEKRSDDNVKSLSIRLEKFKEMTLPLRSFFEEMKVLKKIDASKSVSQVREEIVSSLGL